MDEPPPAACLPQLFELQTTRSPEVVAAVSGERSWTYRELDAAVRRVAARLRALGVREEVPVAFCVNRSLEMLAGLLGILRAGGAYVPLDPMYPPERLRYMIENSSAPVLLGDPAECAGLIGNGTRFVPIDDVLATPDDGRDADEGPCDVRPENLAYIIYTSGSTGRPKGVEITHRGVSNVLHSFCRILELGPGDSVLASASMSFDISVPELFAPLLVGGRVGIVSREVARDGRKLAQLLDSSGVTLFQATPSQWQLLLDSGWEGRPQLQAVCGGEALPRSLADQLLARTRAVWNGYGPTETTIYSTFLRVEPGDGPVPVGGPLDHTTLCFVDESGAEALVGGVGELYIGGIGLARGYRGDPEKTASRFVPDRFGGAPGERLYRTGDLFRRAATGRHEFLGRADHQVKIRGFRVELGEIEAALTTHAAVKSAVVVTEGEGGSMMLVGAIAVAEGARPPAAGEMRTLLRRTLPEYMVPSRFLVLAELPLTPNGKTDRKAVAALAAAPEAARGDVEWSDPLERSLVAIWCEVLRVPQVGALDSFFEMGGNSLLAGRVLARIREFHQAELSWSDFHRDPTVAGLAAAIRGGRGRAGRFPVPLPPEDGRGTFPLSSAQQRLWFVEQLEPGNRAYMFQCFLRFRGPLDIGVLEHTLTEIVRRHAIFRSRFFAEGGRPFQAVMPARTVKLVVLDLRALPEGEREAESLRRAKLDFVRPFDLAGGEPVRWSLHRLGAEDHVLLHHEHHLVHDGWSFRLFAAELVHLYGAFIRGEPSPLPVRVVQFGDFALAEEAWLASPAAREQLDFWRAQLRPDQPPLPLPYDRARPPRQSLAGSSVRVDLPLPLCRAVRGMCCRECVPLYPVLLAAFQSMLRRLTDETFIFTGCGMANRKSRETEGVIGMFVNNVVLQVDLAADPTFAELVAQDRALTVAAQDNADIPFDRVVTALGRAPDLSHNPLFQVMFNFHDSPLPDLRLPGLGLELSEAVSNSSAKFDLNIIVLPHSPQLAALGSGRDPESIHIVWEFSGDLFDRSTIERLAAYYERVLASAVADPGARVSSLPLVEPAALQHRHAAWNQTMVAIPRDQTVHGLFARQAALTPEAPALVADGRTVTYAELAARARSLAAELRARGSGEGAFVAVLLERSVDFVVAVLAILETGAAYVPLDPGFPAERHRFVLSDTAARLLVTKGSPPTAACPPGVAVFDLARECVVATVAEPLAPAGRAESPACVMYTSGSTGRPKGIVVPHRAIVRLVCGQAYAEFGAGERFLLLASPAFDASTFELWGPLLNGGTCVVFAPRLPDLDDLERVLRDERVTCLWLTAGLFNQIVDQRPSVLAGVRHVLAGGEALSVPHVRRVLDALPHLRLTNGYGPTESTTFACTHSIARGEDFRGGSVPIGRPIANTHCVILDEHRRPVPVGAPGELCIGGDGLALGYLNLPELTAERFIADPFIAEPGARLYRTGDRCRWLPDGTIAFLGRLDDQVKIRGFRIEPGEIESALVALPDVAQATVVVREDPPGEKRLVAYVVKRARAATGGSSLRERLRARLPDYMVPAAFVELEQIPLTPSGKVDRRALPRPGAEAGCAVRDHVALATPTERLVAKVWSDVLKVERVGAQDDFFELGGHSLLAMQVTSRLCAALGFEVPLRALFEAGSLARLAAAIDELRCRTASAGTAPAVGGGGLEEGTI